MQYCFSASLGYLLGCINPAYLFGKSRGVDVRKKGSGNAGASNTVILFGNRAGLFVALFDIFKAFFATVLARLFFPGAFYANVVSGTACILGHMFPMPMRFKGGKGFACVGGLLMGLSFKLFFLVLFLTLAVALLSNYVFIAALFAAVAVPVSYCLLVKDIVPFFIMLFAVIPMFFRHRENMARLRVGREAEFSALWQRDSYLVPADRRERLQAENPGRKIGD